MAETVDITTLALKVDATTARVAALELDKFGDSAKNAGSKTDEFVKSVEREAAILGKSRSQVLDFDAAHLGLTKTQMAQVQASLAVIQAHADQEAMMQRVKSAAMGMALAISGSVIGALTAMGLALLHASKAGGEAEAQNIRLEGVLRATGNAAGVTAQQINEMAEALSKKTFFDDDEIKKASAEMLIYRNVQGDTLKEGISLAADLAALYGGSVTDNVRALGRALDDPANGLMLLERQFGHMSDRLKDHIKQLQDDNKLSEAQAIVLDFVRSKVGGLAETMNTGLSAESKNLSKEWGDFVKEVGKMPAVASGAAGTIDALRTTVKNLRAEIAGTKTPIREFNDDMLSWLGFTGKAVKALEDYIEKYKEKRELEKTIQDQNFIGTVPNTSNPQADAAAGKAKQDEQRALDASYASYKKLLDVMKSTGTESQQQEAQVAALAKAWEGMNVTDRAATGFKNLDEATKALIASLPLAKKAAEEYKASIDNANKIVDQAYGKNGDLDKNIHDLGVALKDGAIDIIQYGVAWNNLMNTQTESGKAFMKLLADMKQQQGEADKKSVEDMIQATAEIEKQADAMEKQLQVVQEGSGAYFRAQAAQLQFEIGSTDIMEQTPAWVKNMEARIAAYNRAAAAADQITAAHKREIDAEQQVQKLMKLSQGISNDAQSIGDALSNGFGQAGTKLASLTQALGDFGSKQAEIAAAFQKNMNDAAKSSDPLAAALEAIQKRSEDSAKANIKMYGDMAGAAKGFFKVHSTGYQIMDGLEKAFRVMQIAESTKSFMTQMAQILGLTAAKKAGDDDMLSSLIGYVSKAIGLHAAEGQAAATTAVATQGEGDPYSAFVRIAAMAAIMAAIGFAVGGVGGGGSSGPRGQTPDFMSQTGTGTVLGDASGHSDSITHALDIIKNNSSDDLLYTSQMLASLRGIESSMKGLASMAARLGLTGQGFKVPDSKDGNTFSVSSAGVIIGQYLGGSSEHAQFGGQSVGQLTSNPAAQQFTGIDRTHSGSFGSSYSAINYDYAALAKEFTQQVALAATNMRDALAAALNVLTGGTHTIDQIKEALNGLKVDVTTINFQDLKGADIQNAIEQAFSAIGDNMAQGVLDQLTGPNGLFAGENLDKLSQFQQVGEGAFETVVRVASGVEKAQATLDQWGIHMIDWRDIVNKQGDVTTELIRQSVVQFETSANGAVSGFGKIIEASDKTGDDLIQLYGKLRNVQALLEQSALSADDLNQAMITGAGGVDKLSQGLDVYASLLPAGERATVMLEQVGRQFTSIGVVMPTTVAGLQTLIQHYRDLGDEEMVGKILALVPAWNDAGNAAKDAAETARNSWLDFQDAVDKYLGRDGGQRRLNSAVGAFESQNSAFAGLSVNDLLTAFAGMTQETFNKFDEATQKLIITILGLASDVKSNTQALQVGRVDSQKTLMDNFNKTYNEVINQQPDTGSKLGLRAQLLQDQVTQWQATVDALKTDPNLTLEKQLQAEQTLRAINEAQGELGTLGKQIAAVTILEAQYGKEKGDQLYDLQNWYDAQKDLVGGNQDALLALEKLFQDKRNAILQGGVADGLSSIQDSIKKWRESLLLSDQSPLTNQQRLATALQQYQDTLTKAQGGDQGALQNYQQIAQALLQEELNYYGRASTQYQDIFKKILEDSGALAGVDPSADPVESAVNTVNKSVTDQTAALTAQIDSLTKQVLGLQATLVEVGETLSATIRDTAQSNNAVNEVTR